MNWLPFRATGRIELGTAYPPITQGGIEVVERSTWVLTGFFCHGVNGPTALWRRIGLHDVATVTVTNNQCFVDAVHEVRWIEPFELDSFDSGGGC